MCIKHRLSRFLQTCLFGAGAYRFRAGVNGTLQIISAIISDKTTFTADQDLHIITTVARAHRKIVVVCMSTFRMYSMHEPALFSFNSALHRRVGAVRTGTYAVNVNLLLQMCGGISQRDHSRSQARRVTVERGNPIHRHMTAMF